MDSCGDSLARQGSYRAAGHEGVCGRRHRLHNAVSLGIAIQSLAGHESPQTTARYMHLGAGVQAAAVRLFDRAANVTAPRGTDVSRLDSEE